MSQVRQDFKKLDKTKININTAIVELFQQSNKVSSQELAIINEMTTLNQQSSQFHSTIDHNTPIQDIQQLSVMKQFSQFIKQTTYQYMDLMIKLNPVTMKEYTFPDGSNIKVSVQNIARKKNIFQSIDQIFKLFKGNTHLLKDTRRKIYRILINRINKLFNKTAFCITGQTSRKILLNKRCLTRTQLDIQTLKQYNQEIIQSKLTQIPLQQDIDEVLTLQIKKKMKYYEQLAYHQLHKLPKINFQKLQIAQNVDMQKKMLSKLAPVLDQSKVDKKLQQSMIFL